MTVEIIPRKQVLAFRQHANFLHKRLPRSRLVEAAFAGLQDSSPRSAVLALHARVTDVRSDDWENPQFVQIWGTRGADYVVPKMDLAVFTLGRMPREPSRRLQVEAAAERVQRVPVQDRTKATSSRDLRVASITGRILIRWDGSRITWWAIDPPSNHVEEARLELARRFLRSQGPSTPSGFAWWSGVEQSDAKLTFQLLSEELSEVNVMGRESWVLNESMNGLQRASPAETIRLLPQGDPYLCTLDHQFIVPGKAQRAELWPRSVWPGALFVRGELVGTWRRQLGRVTIRPWRKISSGDKEAVRKEVETMPIDSDSREVNWERSSPSKKSSG